MTHGTGSEGKTCEWSGQPVVLRSTSEHGVSSITTITTADAHTSAVRFAERPKLVSARVPSRFERALLAYFYAQNGYWWTWMLRDLGPTQFSNGMDENYNPKNEEEVKYFPTHSDIMYSAT